MYNFVPYCIAIYLVFSKLSMRFNIFGFSRTKQSLFSPILELGETIEV